MAPWLRKNMRLDIELAVALELASARLQRATDAAERRQALEFNRELWATIRHLAASAPEVDYRAALQQAADQPPPEDAAAVTARNAKHASALAGKAATGGALKNMLNDWRAALRQDPQAEFGSWLLSRMDADLVPLSV